MAVHVLRVGIREDMKTEMEKYVLGGVSAIGGFGISEFTGEYVVKAAGISDAMQKLLIKVATRIGFGLLFAGLSWMTGGILTWIFFAAAMGAIGGIALDILEYFHPAGIKGLAEMAALGGTTVTTEEVSYNPPVEFKVEELPKEETSATETVEVTPTVEVVPTVEEKKKASLYA